MKKLVRDKNPDDGAPALIEMNAIDANHAVAADPERYSIEDVRPVVPSLSLADRVARLENRLGPETPEEIDHRNRRRKELAERAAEERKAPETPIEDESTDIA